MPSSPPSGVLIVIPARNEAESLGSVLDECLQIVPARNIVVVDDASNDGTRETALSRGVPCASLSINLGIGGAVQTGYLHALRHGYRWTVQVDGDGQHDPSEIPALLEPLLRGEVDMVIGSRYLSGSGFRSTFLRRTGVRLISLVIFLTTGRFVRDCTSGYRAVNERVLRLFCDSYPADYPEPESIAMLLHRRLKIREVAVRMRPRAHRSSSIRFLDSLIYMAKVIYVLMMYGIVARFVRAGRDST